MIFSLVRRLKKKIINTKKRNIKLNIRATPVSDNYLLNFFAGKILHINRTSNEFWNWVDESRLTEYKNFSYPPKKTLEFFFSSQLLEITEKDVVLDAAGGTSKYLQAIKNIYHPAKLILQDHIYHKSTEKNGILFVGGDVSNIDLPDKSIDKISCHHSFEHFQENKDSLFIKEIARLLKPSGRAVIIPLFISEKYIECWNVKHNHKFDKEAELLIDETATLPGGDFDGHFARIYNIDSLQRRVLDVANSSGLNWIIATFMLDGEDIPDMRLNVGAIINKLLRALVLNKI